MECGWEPLDEPEETGDGTLPVSTIKREESDAGTKNVTGSVQNESAILNMSNACH